MRNTLGIALGFVCHAMFAVVGIVLSQAGVFWFGIPLVLYAIGNVANELLIINQQKMLNIAEETQSEARINKGLRNGLCDMLGLSRAVSNFEIHETVEVCYEHLKASKRVSNN